MTLALLPSLLVLSFGGVSYAATTPAPSTVCGQSVDNSAKGQVLQGSGQVGQGTDCSGTSIAKLTSSIVRILSTIVGIAAVIVIIIAGLKYITSGGDASKVASAKTTLIYALVGLVIVVLAQFIIRFTVDTANTAAACPVGQSLAKDGKTCVADKVKP